jgi:hypothetical protein
MGKTGLKYSPMKAGEKARLDDIFRIKNGEIKA